MSGITNLNSQISRWRVTSIEEDTQIYIVRIWIERREYIDTLPEWRGVVEHVSGGERRFFKSLDELTDFITNYLRAAGVKIE